MTQPTVTTDLTDVLAVTTETVGDATVVRASGEVDMATAVLLGRELDEVCLAPLPPAVVIIDLAGIRFFGSTGLGVLITTHRRCHDRRIPLRIVAGTHAVLRPLRVSGLDRMFDVTESLTEAIRPDVA